MRLRSLFLLLLAFQPLLADGAEPATSRELSGAAFPEVDPEDVPELLDRQPGFGIFKDNYFITGAALDRPFGKNTSDIKFQISIRQRLTRATLPFKTFLSLTYTQKTFWSVYVRSAPFKDNNYNPGLALARSIVTNNRLRGMASIAFEHESNGMDVLTGSRSCNYFVASGSCFFTPRLSAQLKLWAGWPAHVNPDLWRYRGHVLAAVNYRSPSGIFLASALVNPRARPVDCNTQFELGLRVNPRANHYIMLQWYEGYGENMLEYNLYASMLRIGSCIKPSLIGMY